MHPLHKVTVQRTFDVKELELLIQALQSLNCLAHQFQDDWEIRTRAFGAKAELLSLFLERDVPDIEPAWEQQRNGRYILVFSIGYRFSPHCPLHKLSPVAQRKVIDRIGPAPNEPSATRS